jgi:hypothetical protein
MIDYARPQAKGLRSIKILTEFDRKLEKFRDLQIMIYAGSMGHGKLLGMRSGPAAWQFVTPDSFGESPFQAVCDK